MQSNFTFSISSLVVCGHHWVHCPASLDGATPTEQCRWMHDVPPVHHIRPLAIFAIKKEKPKMTGLEDLPDQHDWHRLWASGVCSACRLRAALQAASGRSIRQWRRPGIFRSAEAAGCREWGGQPCPCPVNVAPRETVLLRQPWLGDLRHEP